MLKNKRRCLHAQASGTFKQIVSPCRSSGVPEFNKVLPGKMLGMVQKGWLEHDDNGGYVITALGRAKLRKMEHVMTPTRRHGRSE